MCGVGGGGGESFFLPFLFSLLDEYMLNCFYVISRERDGVLPLAFVSGRVAGSSRRSGEGFVKSLARRVRGNWAWCEAIVVLGNFSGAVVVSSKTRKEQDKDE